MPLLERMKADIRRRSEMLPKDVQRWKDAIDQAALGTANAGGGTMGIHQSQISALKEMMDGLQGRQTELLDQLDPTGSLLGFSTAYLKLSDEIVSAHELWRIFRYIIALHEDATIGPLIDAADLVAADCYLTCMNKVRAWNLVAENQFRAPPLVFLEAEMSPSTASRGYSAGALPFPLRRYRNMRLPIPLILLPSDTATSMWMLCTLHHEVGHNLDQDLKLQAEMSGRLLTRLQGNGTSQDLQKMWWQWTAEILADAFGVLLGGAGFAHALCWWLLVLAPEPTFQTLNTDDVHPPYFVRIHLIAAMLRQFKIPALDDAARSIVDTWEAQQKPDWVGPYVADSDLVADVFMNQALDALGQRPLTDLGPDLADDIDRVARLESFLRTGISSPDPKLASSARWRHIPMAAQLAFIAQATPDSASLDRIQKRAFAYLSNLDRPKKMAGSGDKSDFFRQLVRDLKFS
jgi:hypothetical protein